MLGGHGIVDRYASERSGASDCACKPHTSKPHTCGPYGATHRSRARDSSSTCAGSGAVTCPAGCGYASIRPGAASPHAP